jgi:hypothetical protein
MLSRFHFPEVKTRKKQVAGFARGGKIYSRYRIGFQGEEKKQRTNECTKHSFNVANEKKRGTQTARTQNRGILDYFYHLFRFFRALLCSFGVEVLKK